MHFLEVVPRVNTCAVPKGEPGRLTGPPGCKIARRVDQMAPTGFAAPQLWRFADGLYLRSVCGPLLDVAERVNVDQFADRVQIVVLPVNDINDRVRQSLRARGYENRAIVKCITL